MDIIEQEEMSEILQGRQVPSTREMQKEVKFDFSADFLYGELLKRCRIKSGFS